MHVSQRTGTINHEVSYEVGPRWPMYLGSRRREVACLSCSGVAILSTVNDGTLGKLRREKYQDVSIPVVNHVLEGVRDTPSAASILHTYIDQQKNQKVSPAASGQS